MPPIILRRPSPASYCMAIMLTPRQRGVVNDAQSLRVVVHAAGPGRGEAVAHSRTAPLSMPRMNWRWKNM